MKFLILTQYFPPEIGAAQTRLSALAHQLVARGHEVEIVTALPNYPEGKIYRGYKGSFYVRDSYEGVPVHRVWLYACLGTGARRILNYLSFSITCVWGVLKAKRPDFLFIESPPLFLVIPGLILARLFGACSILNVADLWPDSVIEMGLMSDGLLVKAANIIERWAYRHATFVVAVTEGIREALQARKNVSAQKILFLPNGVDLERYRLREPDLALQRQLGLEDKKIILYQGTQGYAHGIEPVLYTAELLRSDPDIHFLFVGEGSEHKRLEALKAKLQLTNVTFLPSVPMQELPRYFSISVCGLVSLRDIPLFKGARPGKCNPIFASAKPIIFFGSGEAADLVRRANAGLVVAHRDTRGLAEAFRRIVRNPELAAELGRNGRLYAEQFLSWSTLADTWLADLQQRSAQWPPSLSGNACASPTV